HLHDRRTAVLGVRLERRHAPHRRGVLDARERGQARVRAGRQRLGHGPDPARVHGRGGLRRDDARPGHRHELDRDRGPSSPARALATAGTAKLEYHGGPIMPSNTNYAFYWDPPGGPSYPAAYQSGLNTFFEDLAHDSGGLQNVDSVATQYNDSASEFANYDSHFGWAILDTDP